MRKKYMKFMGIDSPEELYRISAEDIALQQNDFTNYCGLGAGTFRITVDNDFVPEFPIPAVGEGAAKGIPLLIGTTNEELSFLFVKPVSKALDIMSLIRKMTNHEDEEIKKMMFETYEKFYKGRKVKTMMFTDFMFRIGSVWYAEEFSKHSDVWMYRFDFETTAMRVSRLHSFHSSDLPFVFGNFRSDMAKLMLLFTPFKKKPRLVADEIQRDFIEFARTGKLQWSNCQNNDTPAKCYNMNTFIEPIVKPDIKEQYKGTHLRKICFQKSMIGRR